MRLVSWKVAVLVVGVGLALSGESRAQFGLTIGSPYYGSGLYVGSPGYGMYGAPGYYGAGSYGSTFVTGPGTFAYSSGYRGVAPYGGYGLGTTNYYGGYGIGTTGYYGGYGYGRSGYGYRPFRGGRRFYR